MSEKTCPNCGKAVDELLRLDADMKGRLSQDLGMPSPPEAVCPNCYQTLGNQLSANAAKRSRRIAKEQQRLNLWRSRVHLIREARDRFAMKDFAGAVVAYEKYFRVLEIIYEVKPNEIQVTHFNNSARSKELVVITSAYWDLMRIYDQSPRFKKRLEQCAEKLGQFLPYTPIYAEILRKIDDYKKNSKNRAEFDKVIKVAGKSKKRCFIATAAFHDPFAPEVIVLSAFRDDVLLKTAIGRAFTATYYSFSPAIAKALDRHPRLQRLTRAVLAPMAAHLGRKYSLKNTRQ